MAAHPTPMIADAPAIAMPDNPTALESTASHPTATSSTPIPVKEESPTSPFCCSICSHPWQDPVVGTSCVHIYCKECATNPSNPIYTRLCPVTGCGKIINLSTLIPFKDSQAHIAKLHPPPLSRPRTGN